MAFLLRFVSVTSDHQLKVPPCRWVGRRDQVVLRPVLVLGSSVDDETMKAVKRYELSRHDITDYAGTRLSSTLSK